MDLTLNASDSVLNIRAAVLIKSERGFLFEQNAAGFVFAVGGRVKLHEVSVEAAKRELEEELGIHVAVADLKLRAAVENFYRDNEGNKVHEILFVYQTTVHMNGELPPGFVEITKENVGQFDIKPKLFVELITSVSDEFQHLVNNEL